MKFLTINKLWATALVIASLQTAQAAEHEVKAVGVKFEPANLVIAPGDTVTFSNMSAHLIETIDQMVPEGQEKVLTDMGVDVTITFDTEGVIVYKCTPHWGARMGGVILVGDPADKQAILDGYMASIETAPENKPAKGLLKKFAKFLEAEGKL